MHTPGTAGPAAWALLWGRDVSRKIQNRMPPILGIGAATLCLCSYAQAEEAKWAPWLDVGAKIGNTRRIGETDLFLPLAQDGERLLFLDLRGIVDDQEQREGNVGLGYRQMLDDGWNLGVYGFFDRRRSATNHHYSQATLGAEALGRDVDFRVNGYLPLGRKVNDVEGSARADLVGGTIRIQSSTEHAYHGADAEMGWRVPLFDAEGDNELRLYGGGYWFDADQSDTVAGPRGRLEYRLYDPLEDLPGSRLTVSGEIQHDSARGTQEFLGLKFRIPLQAEAPTRRLNAQERRMADPIIRDVDIVTQSATLVEAAKFDGQTLSSVATIKDGTTAQATINAAGTNTLVVVQGTTTVSSQLTLLTGQTLSGGGTTLTLTGASSGRQVAFTLPGSTATLSGSVAGTSVLALAQGSTLRGVKVQNTSTATNSHAVSATNVSNATVTGSTLSAAKGNGLYASGSSGLSVSGSTISASGNDFGAIRLDQTTATVSGNTLTSTGAGNGTTFAHALWITNGGGSTVSNNTISASGMYGNAMFVDNSAAITLSGNTLTASGYAGRGLHIANSAGSTISGNTITTRDTSSGMGFYTSPTGLFLESSANTTLSNNTITTAGEAAGMNLRYSTGLTVSGNTITTTGTLADGLVLTGSTNATVRGNRVTTTGSSSHGIQFFVNATGTLAENNTVAVSGASSKAVTAMSVSDLRVINNRLVGVGNGGVYESYTTNITVSGNTP